MTTALLAPTLPQPEAPVLARTSDLLKGILTRNPDTQVFTIGQIMRSLGDDRFDANMLFMNLPTLGSVPDTENMRGLPAAIVAGQMVAGHKKPALPQTLLDREIPRRSLAVAIHLALPVIEAAEKVARPRMRWLSNPFSRRILGAFLFVLAATVAFPLIGFDPLQSLSTFTISFGLAEGDGAAILLGVAVGVLSLGVIVASKFSAGALRSGAASWLRKIARKLGASALARFCELRGLSWISKILNFEWSRLLLRWNPERDTAPGKETAGASAKQPHATNRASRNRTAERPAPRRRQKTELVAFA